jgi:hypothetical protein
VRLRLLHRLLWNRRRGFGWRPEIGLGSGIQTPLLNGASGSPARVDRKIRQEAQQEEGGCQDRRGYDVLGRFAESGWDGKVGLGVIDIHTNFIEPPELVRDRILYAARVLGPERIEVNTDCGLRTRTWEVSLGKLKNMVEGTRLAEEALNGS